LCDADSIEEAVQLARSGKVDLLLADLGIDIRDLVARIDALGLPTPVVACGPESDARTAAGALAAGAKEYLPLPCGAETIASMFATLAADQRANGDRPSVYQSQDSQSAE
jgi:two-component system, response regulator FlrC